VRGEPLSLSETQREELSKAFAFYRDLDAGQRARFELQVARFLDTKRFVSDKDPVDDRTKLLIAALACRMTLGLVHEELRRLDVINVVDTLESTDGRNVVYHEIAHVLDAADGISDGIPPLLLHPADHERWRVVMARELDRLRAAVALGIPTALDPYGKKSEVELFAVASEALFERPEKLRNAHPELYDLLARFYGVQ
jgi:Mlc titration factor MtfA (ptsG expression regulator)